MLSVLRKSTSTRVCSRLASLNHLVRVQRGRSDDVAQSDRHRTAKAFENISGIISLVCELVC